MAFISIREGRFRTLPPDGKDHQVTCIEPYRILTTCILNLNLAAKVESEVRYSRNYFSQ